MNKNVFAVCAIFALSLSAVAQGPLQFPKHWQESIEQNVGAVTFKNALGVLEKSLLLEIPVTKQYFPSFCMPERPIPFEDSEGFRDLQRNSSEVRTYPTTAGCKAYALDEHWVMAGGPCIWNARHTIDFTPRSPSYIFETGLVEPDATKKYLKVNGSEIAWQPNLFIQQNENKAPHIILVRLPEKTDVAQRLKRWPKINILAFNKTTPADLTGGNFFINSARFGINGTHERNLKTVNAKTVTLEDNFYQIPGLSTDPLAYIKGNQIRWIGVNQGVTELRYENMLTDWDGKPSNEYFFFSAEDAAFIKQTISQHDPAAWQRIEARKGLEIL